jgi:hypothetical protein
MCKNHHALKLSEQCPIDIETRNSKSNDDRISNTFKEQLNDKNDKDKVTKYIEIKSEYKNDFDKRPLIKIEIYGNEYQALLDTGASISIFGSGTDHLWHVSTKISIKKVDLKLPNGETMKQQVIKSIPIKFEDITKEIKIAYSPAVVYPLIMGANFLQAFNLKICRQMKINETSDDEMECCALNSSNEEMLEIPDHLKIKLNKLISDFPFDDGKKLGCQNILRHKIDTGENDPVIQHQYSYNKKVLDKIHIVIDDWLKQGVIEKSTSAWRNPIVVVKKQDGNIPLLCHFV